MTMGAAGFLTAVTEIIRLGGELHESHRTRLREKPFSVLMPNVPRLEEDSRALEAFMLDFARAQRAWWETPDCPLHGLFDPNSPAVVLTPGVAVEKVKLACDMAVSEVCKNAQPPSVTLADGAEPLDLSAAVVLKQWSELPNAGRNRWIRLGFSLGRSAAAVIGSDPALLARFGVEERTRTIIGAVAQNLSGVIGSELIEGDASESFGERAAKIFVSATFETVASKPELLIEKPHMAALFKAVAEPLAVEVTNKGSLKLPALARFREMMRGPMAIGVLQVIHDHSDAFITGEAAKDDVLGVVAHKVLAQIVSTNQHVDFDLMRYFSGGGTRIVLNAALEAARDRPELFIEGQDEDKDAARAFLRKVAEKAVAAPRPFNLRSGLAPQIAAVTLDTAAAYLRRRLSEESGQSEWSRIGLDVGDHLIDQIFLGFKSVASVDENGREIGYNPFEHLFTRDQAVDILRTIAARAAETPGMIVDDKANPEVKNIAAAVFRFVANDQNRLLTAEDWRGLIGVALAEGAKNPGALFSLDPDAAPESHFAVMLIERVLAGASADLNARGRRPGALLFGETLRETISVTLKAAANNAKSLLPEVRAQRAGALGAFIETLSKMAVGEREDLRMGASEWLYVYRWYVAHVVDTGRPEDITPEMIGALLRQVGAASSSSIPAGALQ